MLSCDCDSILLVSAVESTLFSPGCCKYYRLIATGGAAEKWPYLVDRQYRYKATGEVREGAPVYRNSDDKYLFRHSDGTWRAGPRKGGNGIIRSVDTITCPTGRSQWEYQDGPGIWRSADIRFRFGIDCDIIWEVEVPSTSSTNLGGSRCPDPAVSAQVSAIHSNVLL